MSPDPDENSRGKGSGVLVVGGPSGAGKSTLVQAVLDPPRVRLAISATTRPPRPGEVDGRDYHFVDEAAFMDLVEREALVEWARVHERCYGTPKTELLPAAMEERCVIVDVDVQGLRNLRTEGIPHRSLFIAPPDLETLRERLGRRGTESEETLAVRLRNAENELTTRDEYDAELVNEELDRSIALFREQLAYASRSDHGAEP